MSYSTVEKLLQMLQKFMGVTALNYACKRRCKLVFRKCKIFLAVTDVMTMTTITYSFNN